VDGQADGLRLHHRRQLSSPMRFSPVERRGDADQIMTIVMQDQNRAS
jgi:hypothetical protein